MGMAFIPDEAMNVMLGGTRKLETGVKPATGVNPLNPVDPNRSGLVEVEKGPRPNGVIIGGIVPVIGNMGNVELNPGGKIEPIPTGNNEFVPVTADTPGFMVKSRAACSSIMNRLVGDKVPVLEKNGLVPGKNVRFVPTTPCMVTVPGGNSGFVSGELMRVR
jgi:hypothetical protein